MNELTDFQLELARVIALGKTKQILIELDIDVNHHKYPSIQYEMQFDIYHAIKKALQEC